MVDFSKIIPALALTAVMGAPLAAQARTAPPPRADIAHMQILVGQYSNEQVTHGRLAAVTPQGGLTAVDVAPLYAALNAVPIEN